MIPPPVHGGNVQAIARKENLPLESFIDYSASINPLGLPKSVRRAVVRAIPDTIHYPEPFGDELRKRIGTTHHIDPESLVLGNGSAELISILPRALSIKHGLVIGPTFMEFERALGLAGARCTYVHADADDLYDPPIDRVCRMLSCRHSRPANKTSASRHHGKHIDAVFLCNPNSPTGRGVSSVTVHRLLNRVRQAQARLIVDEAFVDFWRSYSVLKDAARFKNLLVIRSFTKFFAMPGLRIGYLVGAKNVVDRIQELIPPWSVNSLAQAAAMAALDDQDYRRRSVTFMRRERTRFGRLLRQVPGIRLVPSHANYFLLELPPSCTANRVADWCRERKMLVRDCQDFAGLHANVLRVAIRRSRENDRLLTVLTQAIDACR